MQRNYTNLDCKFIKALKSNDAVGIQECLEQGANINLRIYDLDFSYLAQSSLQLMRETIAGYKYPIHLAAMKGSTQILKLLLQNNAPIDAIASDNSTPLLLATYSNHLSAVKFLLQRGANINQTLHDNSTALHSAAYKGWADITQVLINYQADINKADNYGETPLIAAVFAEKFNTVKVLVTNHADVTKTIPNGVGPVFFAAQAGLTNILSFLLENQANPNEMRITDKLSALHIAAKKGHFAAVKLLVDKGAKIEHKDIDDETAADLAKQAGYTFIANYLQQLSNRQLSASNASLFAHKPTDAEAQAKELYKEGKYKEAIRYFESAINAMEASAHPRLACSTAHCYFALKEYTKAIEHYTKTLDLSENSITAYQWRAKSYRKLAEIAVSNDKAELFINLATADESMVVQLRNTQSKNLVV